MLMRVLHTQKTSKSDLQYWLVVNSGPKILKVSKRFSNTNLLVLYKTDWDRIKASSYGVLRKPYIRCIHGKWVETISYWIALSHSCSSMYQIVSTQPYRCTESIVLQLIS